MVARSVGPVAVLWVGRESDLVRNAVAALEPASEETELRGVETVERALDRLSERRYDCLVLCHEESETALADAVGSFRSRWASLPVVVVTDDPGVTDAALSAGATEVFVTAEGRDDRAALTRRLETVVSAHTWDDEREDDGATAEPSDRAEEIERLRTVLEALPNEVYTLDMDGHFRSVVPAGDRETTVSGYEPSELVGEHVSTVMADADLATGRDAVRELVEDNGTERVSFEAYFRTDDGEQAPHVVHVAPLREGEGDRVTGTVGVLYDVSERVERERRLREKSEFVELTLDTIDDAFYLIDEHGELVRWNETFRVVTGYSDAELDGMDALELFEGTDRDCVADAIARTLETGIARVEADFVRADGSTVPFEFTGARLTDDDGDLRGVVGVGRDISGRREREQKFKQIRKHTSDVIWMRSPEKDVISFVSEAYEDIWGRSTESLLAAPESFVEAVHPDDRDRVEAALAEQRHDPDSYNETYRVVQPDGEVRWVRDRASAVYDDGELARIVGVASDITERTERERELQLKNRVIEEAPVGITIHDATDPRGTLTYANDRLSALTGYEASTLRDGWLSVLRGSETGPRQLATLERGMRDREPTTAVVLLYHRDGTPFWSRTSLAPVQDDDGTVTHFVGFHQDVTESKEHEQRVERRLDEFSDLLAEELKTPVERALEEFDRAQADGTDDAIGAAEKWVEQLSRLIDDLAAIHSFSVKSRETAAAMTTGTDTHDDQ